MMQGTATVGKPIDVTDADFERQVLGADGPVVVDFWAPWCPPCRVIGPILAELAGEYAGRLTIAKVNIDEQQRSMIRYSIQGAPTLVIFKDGKEVDRLVGARRKSNYQEHFDAVLQIGDA
jgi:thioredoxin 1